MADLGERCFPVDSTASAQDLCDELDMQFPRVVYFELLRACEASP